MLARGSDAFDAVSCPLFAFSVGSSGIIVCRPVIYAYPGECGYNNTREEEVDDGGQG